MGKKNEFPSVVGRGKGKGRKFPKGLTFRNIKGVKAKEIKIREKHGGKDFPSLKSSKSRSKFA